MAKDIRNLQYKLNNNIRFIEFFSKLLIFLVTTGYHSNHSIFIATLIFTYTTAIFGNLLSTSNMFLSHWLGILLRKWSNDIVWWIWWQWYLVAIATKQYIQLASNTQINIPMSICLYSHMNCVSHCKIQLLTRNKSKPIFKEFCI